MVINWRRFLLFYSVPWLGLVILTFLYARGVYWPSMYGGVLHKISRFHVLTVHFTVGCLVLLSVIEALCFLRFDWAQGLMPLRIRFHHLAHTCTLFSLYSGVVNQLIERSQNPAVDTHFWGGVGVYAGLLCLTVMATRNFLGRWASVAAFCFIILIMNTSKLGGLIYKGSEFFN